MIGRVSWFNVSSGEGVVRGINGKNYYLHYSAIQMDGYKEVKPSELVTIEVLDDEFARHVTKLVRTEYNHVNSVKRVLKGLI